jgi:phage tail sheath gpL-like
MAISFNNIPNTIRTPGVYTEIDNSRALKGLIANPHRALIIGQKTSEGSIDYDTLVEITSNNLADGFFGPGSIAARMCNRFKEINEKTEVFGIAIGSDIAGTAASAEINYSAAMYSDVISGTGTYNLMINGVQIQEAITSGMSGMAIASIIASNINQAIHKTLPVRASNVTDGTLNIYAICSGTVGNYINIRHNYYTGQSTIAAFSTEPTIVSMAGGATDPALDDVWAVIGDQQFHYIVQPYIDVANLTSIEDELDRRFGPMVDLAGHGFTFARGNLASCSTLGDSRNSPHNTIGGLYDMPEAPEEWGSILCGLAATHLHDDPARPLHYLQMGSLLPPPVENRFDQQERNLLLWDGIASFTYDAAGKPLIERCITSYRVNNLGIPDASYLDIQTLATLIELRFQDKARMVARFILPRFKLADDSFPVKPGSNIATPKTVRQETIALFTQLRDRGLIENLAEFIDNLVVERNEADRDRVDRLLPPDLINQFRVLAGKIQFIL